MVEFVLHFLQDLNLAGDYTSVNDLSKLDGNKCCPSGKECDTIEVYHPSLAGRSQNGIVLSPSAGQPKVTEENIQRGSVVRMNQKGFGFIRNEATGEEFFFHFTDVIDAKQGLPAIGDSVSFTTCHREKGMVAIQVSVAWHYGVVVKFVSDRGFGFIRAAERAESIFFHRDELGDTNIVSEDPFPGNYVAFSQITQGQRGPVARNVNRIVPSVGIVTQWNRRTGLGELRLEGSEKVISVSRGDILPRDLKDSTLEAGWSVSFIISNGVHGLRALCLEKELPLRRFARIADENRMLEDLAAKVLPGENWQYRESHTHSRFPILENYLFYTFQRLEEEDEGRTLDERKIKIASTKDGLQKAAFNTGLVDEKYRPIFAGFSRKSNGRPGEPQWNFECFVARGEIAHGRSYMSIFPNLPERAEYFTDPSDVVYDTSLRLDAVTDHIVGDRWSRLSKKLRACFENGFI